MRLMISVFWLWLSAQALAQGPEAVTLVRFDQVAVTQQQVASATVESLNQARVAAEINARVVDVPVRVGELVRAGQVLVRLDASEFELMVQAAQAGLDVAEAGLDMARLRAERARRLAPDQFVSDDDLLVAETRLSQAEAERAAARVELDRAKLMRARTTITSPYDAVVQARLIGAGALAAPGTPLLGLVAIEPLEGSSGIAGPLVEGLTRSAEIEFFDGERHYPLRLLRVSPLVSPGARQREARFEFTGTPPAPGTQGSVIWTDPRPVLPADFVVLRGDELGVMFVESDRASASTADVRWLPLPQADAGRPVRVDLPADRLLVDEGRRRVQPGQIVEIRAGGR